MSNTNVDDAFHGGFDYNGDGFDDIVVGNPGYDTAFTDIGGVHIFFGPVTGGKDVSNPGDADLFFSPASGASLDAGYRLSSGDFDGNGYDDILVSGYNTDRMWVIYDGLEGLGSITNETVGVETIDGYKSGDAFGDWDDDGLDDVWLSTERAGSEGNEVLSLGSTGLGFSDYSVTTHSYEAASGTGDQCDINGDGFADILIRYSTSAIIYWGGLAGWNYPSGWSFGDVDYKYSSSLYAHSLYALACVGDVTGDGYHDGAFGASSQITLHAQNGALADSGYVAVLPGGNATAGTDGAAVSGSLYFTDVAYRIEGASRGDYVGHRATTAGDVDNDGVNDLLVGTNSSQEQTRLFYGPIASGVQYISAGAAEFGVVQGNEHGSHNSPQPAGDVNGDGYDDFLVGWTYRHSDSAVALFLGMEN